MSAPADYIAAGFALVPIPLGSKGPTLKGWNTRAACIIDLARAQQLRGNIGLAHAYSRTAVLDVDDYAQAEPALGAAGVNLPILLMADDAVQIRSGRSNRAKLLYRLPKGVAPLATRQLDGYELRCATDDGLTVQDVLPPSIHPDTDKPYEWGGAGHFSRLPVLPPELLAHWYRLGARTEGNGRASKRQEAFDSDPVLKHLRLVDLVQQEKPDGNVWIMCPFEAEHTHSAQPFGTSYFVAHTNGFANGHFRCMHAHCGNRTDDDFLQAVGYSKPAIFGVAGAPAANTLVVDDGVVLMRASDLKPEPIRWLWGGWLALGKLHILAGAPGQGKTTIGLAFAATVTVGGRWPDGSRCDPGNVLIWSGEDDPADTLLPRLLAMGADTSKAFFVKATRLGGEVVPFDPARDFVQLAAEAERRGGVRLLMVDPVVSAVAGDSHKNTEVRRALQPLVDLAAAINCAVVGISHFGKNTAGRDPTERVVGSVAFGAVARVVMAAAKVKSEDGEATRILVRSKSNIGPDEGGFDYAIEQIELDAHPGIHASRVTWGRAVKGTARELLAEAEADGDAAGSVTEEAVEALRYILASDVVPSKVAVSQMKAEGFSEKVTRTARERLGVIVKRSGFGKDMTSYWRLPHAVVPTRAQLWRSNEQGMNGHECEPKGTDISAADDAEVN